MTSMTSMTYDRSFGHFKFVGSYDFGHIVITNKIAAYIIVFYYKINMKKYVVMSYNIATGPRLLIIKVTVKNWPFTNRFYLTFFLNSIGLLAKKEKNHNNVT